MSSYSSSASRSARNNLPFRPDPVVTQPIPEPVKEPPVKATAAETPSEIATPNAAAPKTPAKETVAGKAPVKKTAETKSSTPATRGLYYVQVLAIADRADAQAAADKYRKQGYTAIITDPPAGEKNFKVRLGGYATRDRAVDLLKKLNAAAGKKTDYWVVQY